MSVQELKFQFLPLLNKQQAFEVIQERRTEPKFWSCHVFPSIQLKDLKGIGMWPYPPCLQLVLAITYVASVTGSLVSACAHNQTAFYGHH